MDFGRILTVFNSMKNVNMSGTPASEEPVEETKSFKCDYCYDNPEGSDCSNCNGTGQVDLGWGETVNCGHCNNGKTRCRCGNGPLHENDDEGPAGKYGAGLMWQRDEMDIPDESYFKDEIAGEKHTPETINDHDLTVDDQLEQEGLEESHRLPASWPLDFKNVHRKQVSKVLDEYKGFGDVRDTETRYDEMNGDITTELKYDDGTVILINTQKYNGKFGHNVTVLKSKVEESMEISLNPFAKEKPELCQVCGINKPFRFFKNRHLCRACIADSIKRRQESGNRMESVDADLKNLVHSFVQNSENKRRIDQNRSQAEHEIRWCQNAIKKLEGMLERKPSKIKEINDLKRQIRDKELKLAFDPYYGGEVRELPIERQLVDKLEEMSIAETIRKCIDQLNTINESAPPDQEEWVKKNKARFIDEYGEEKGLEVLYATAWKRHNKKS